MPNESTLIYEPLAVPTDGQDTDTTGQPVLRAAPIKA